MRSQEEIDRLRADRGGLWPLIRWIHRRRPILTNLLVIAAPVYALAARDRPVDLLDPSRSALFIVPWLLMILGVAIRMWGSGNLQKNREITQTGIYQMVRHPLYTGSLAFFLAYFLTVGDPAVGVGLFLALVFLVYYPTMLGEEEYLSLRFPDQAASRARLPRLIPNPLRLPEALRTDRFTLHSAYHNLGVRSLGFLIFLPLFLKALIWVHSHLNVSISAGNWIGTG